MAIPRVGNRHPEMCAIDRYRTRKATPFELADASPRVWSRRQPQRSNIKKALAPLCHLQQIGVSPDVVGARRLDKVPVALRALRWSTN